MSRRRSSLVAVSEETPVAILRSDQYFCGVNALENDTFSIHTLLDLQCHQMRKILKMLLYTGKKEGEVARNGMEGLAS
jgi:hypothetical protein